MLDTKINKPIDTKVKEKQYLECANWCNETQQGHIEDKGTYYEVVANEIVPPQPIEPSQLDIIEAQVMYTALMTDTLIESEV